MNGGPHPPTSGDYAMAEHGARLMVSTYTFRDALILAIISGRIAADENPWADTRHFYTSSEALADKMMEARSAPERG